MVSCLWRVGAFLFGCSLSTGLFVLTVEVPAVEIAKEANPCVRSREVAALEQGKTVRVFSRMRAQLACAVESAGR